MRTLLVFIFVTLSVVIHAQKKLEFRDKTYEGQIRTVQCYPNQPIENPYQYPPAVRLEAQNLVLEFDDLQDQRNNYYAKLIHCNYDWTKSNLNDLDFLRDYNEFPINEYSFSLNTQLPYVHYRFALPAVKLPGNYLLIIYRDGVKEDLILSRRILVFSEQLSLTQTDDLSGLGNLRSSNQAINFMLEYGRTEIINPASNLHVTIRQNQRWDKSQRDVSPSFIRENSSQIEYRLFDMDKAFTAGNEFRWVDFRSLNYPGQNTGRMDKMRKPYALSVALDGPRGSQAYAQYMDMDGAYIIDNQDYRQEPWVSANYVNVTFTLQSPPVKGDVYVLGAFNAFDISDESKMTYESGYYTRQILLKQGLYNYQYWVSPSDDGNEIEGNHYQTENVYDVMVYYRPFQPNADLLIGYFVIQVNPR